MVGRITPEAPSRQSLYTSIYAQAVRLGAAFELPVLGEDELVALARAYPPKCRGPNETELSHERYAGAAALVAALVATAENEKETRK